MSFRWSDVMLSPKVPSFSSTITKESTSPQKKKKKWGSPFRRRASPSSVSSIEDDAAAAVAASGADQETQEDNYDYLTKTWGLVTTGYKKAKGKTVEVLPSLSGTVEKVESLTVKIVVYTSGFLPEPAKSAVKDLDSFDRSLKKLDESLNPVIKSTTTKTIETYKAAEEKAKVVKAVAPVVSFVGKFLPIETTKAISIWLIKKVTA
ncbi:hypothetical protein TrRE_jg10185 [Triparma retinervis]|uniref:Uncharacterized protein n=1 Tax=Triparma retinervis TaxID=2557542 RepID=A0A9W7E2S2_9STRA|nr:hypothetical protein TrRE_jg10185 [Triparma retinervis]